EPLAAAFRGPLGERVVRDTRVLDGLDDHELAEAVDEVLGAREEERRRSLAEELREAQGARRLALGLSEVAAALSSGRVSHLVYDPGTRYTGSVSADGTLLGWEEGAGDGVTPDTRFTERLVERAL